MIVELIFALSTLVYSAGGPTPTCKDMGAKGFDPLEETRKIGNIKILKYYANSTGACTITLTFNSLTSEATRTWSIQDNGSLTITDYNDKKGLEHNQVLAIGGGGGGEPEFIPWKNEKGEVSENGFTLKFPNGEKVQVDAKKGHMMWEESYKQKTTTIVGSELLLEESLAGKTSTPILNVYRSEKNDVVIYDSRQKGQIPMAGWLPVRIIHPLTDGTMRVCQLEGSYFFKEGKFVEDKKTKKIKYTYKTFDRGGKTWFQDFSQERLNILQKNFCNDKNTKIWSSKGPSASKATRTR